MGVPRSLGIWKFSKNIEPAREFLRVTRQSSPRDAILWAETEIKKMFEK